jgi:hypothetical protein
MGTIRHHFATRFTRAEIFESGAMTHVKFDPSESRVAIRNHRCATQVRIDCALSNSISNATVAYRD